MCNTRVTEERTGADGNKWVTITYFDDNDHQLGQLVFTEPNVFDGEIHIQELTVESSERRRGVGTALINHLKAACQSLYDSVPINAYITSTESLDGKEQLPGLIRFYQANGFNVTVDSDNEATGIFTSI